jgi:hypothetical protein
METGAERSYDTMDKNINPRIILIMVHHASIYQSLSPSLWVTKHEGDAMWLNATSDVLNGLRYNRIVAVEVVEQHMGYTMNTKYDGKQFLNAVIRNIMSNIATMFAKVFEKHSEGFKSELMHTEVEVSVEACTSYVQEVDKALASWRDSIVQNIETKSSTVADAIEDTNQNS